MNEHDIFQKAFTDLHASDDTLLNVMNRVHSVKGTKGISKRAVVLVAAVVMLFSTVLVVQGSLLLADRVAVLTPAKDPGQVIDDAFGNKISSEKVPMYDCYGNPVEAPNTERPTVDLAEVKRLYGDYISDVDAAFSFGESIFTLKNFLIDETGVGAFIWTVEDPNGIRYIYGDNGFMCFDHTSPFVQPSLRHFGADGQEKKFGCDFTALISKNEDDTKLELVSYFGTFDSYEIGDHFVWKVSNRADTKIKTVQITPVSHIPAKRMTAADGTLLTVGSQGLVIDVNSNNETETTKIVLHFKDGTQYCLEDRANNIFNSSGALSRSSEAYYEDDLVILYNRLIDIKEVASVEISAEIPHSVLVGEDYDVFFEYKNYVFYP